MSRTRRAPARAAPTAPAPAAASPTTLPSAAAPPTLDRRAFLRHAGAGAATAFALATLALPGLSTRAEATVAGALGPRTKGRFQRRHQNAWRYRLESANLAARRNHPVTILANNREEDELPGFVANYSKALPHNDLGEVEPTAYAALLAAVQSGRPADFDAIPLAGPRKLTSPQAGLAFDLEGPDSHSLVMRPAPRIDGPENSAEMGELYWMALCRDVGFADYADNALVAAAADDLSTFSDFRGPKSGGRVTPATLFRGSAPGDLVGPYVSQFLLLDVPYGSMRISHRQQTVLPGLDYLTSYADWLAVQDGAPTGPDALAPTPRYIRNLRDLAHYVHVDQLYQAYLSACLILLGLGAPIDPGLPPVSSPNQLGFVEFGRAHVLTLVTEVATRALKAVWCQKWLVHRRARPEEFGGRVHNHLVGAASYPIDREILESPVIARVAGRYGTALLPQAYPEGCPTHPAYGAGHATVAGACVTVLKAFFDTSFVLPDPVVPNADGTALLPYDGPALTVANELDKVAANVALGRSAAGIHWRSDYRESIALGETVAIGILEEHKASHNQDFTYTLTKFDGTTITI